jgi:hypothetical protein
MMRPLASVDYGSGFSKAWSNVATFVPKFIAFVIILVIGWLIAKAIEKILDKVLQRAGFDRLVERGGIKKALASSKFDAAAILGRLVFYAIMLFTLSTAFGVFGTNPVSSYLHAVVAYLPKVFVAVLIIVVAAAVGAAVKGLIQNSLGGLSYGRMLANVAAAVILALGIIAALDQLEIAQNVVNAVLYAALAAIVGVIVVAVGGGGITPMRSRWEDTLTKYDEEKPKIAQQIAQAPSVRDQAQQATQSAVAAAAPESRGGASPA